MSMSTLKYICIFFEGMDLFLIRYFYFYFGRYYCRCSHLEHSIVYWFCWCSVGISPEELPTDHYPAITKRTCNESDSLYFSCVTWHFDDIAINSFLDTILTAHFQNCHNIQETLRTAVSEKNSLWWSNTWIHFSSFYKIFFLFLVAF